MGGLFRCHNINRVFLSVVLTTFTITYATPLQAAPVYSNANEVAFYIRLEKLVHKLIKSENKGGDNMISALVDIKNEIESTYNTSLNTSQFMDQVEKEINKSGQKAPKKELNAIRKKIDKTDKKNKGHALYVANAMYME